MSLHSPESQPSWPARLRSFVLTLCLFLVVAGVNWGVSERFGSDIPDWDQYDAEGLNSLVPWFEHDHFIAHLFTPHNEHRVVLTKLQNLAVVVLGGQWDQRAECFFNALLHALIAVGLWVVGRRWIASAAGRAAYYALIALVYALPLAWQNIIGGFHSQQYWVIGLSFAALVLLPFARMTTAVWWFGLAASVVVLGSMASGFLVAVIIAAMIGWRILKGEATVRGTWVVLVVMAALVAVGFATRHEVPWHAELKVKTVHDFVLTVVRSLEWPMFDHDWGGIVLWAPWLIVTIAALARFWSHSLSRPSSRAELTVIAMGSWVLLQVFATAYGRGAGAAYPASRYMDTLMFACMTNALALIWLMEGPPTARPWQRIGAWMLGATWLTVFGCGLHQEYDRTVRHELPDTRKYYVGCEAHLRSFLATNDVAELTDPTPYPNAGALAERLGHSCLRDRMPASVRAPLTLKPTQAGTTHFVPNQAVERFLDTAERRGLSPGTPALASRPTWGSFTADGLKNMGEWRSEPLTATLGGWLRFETAGDVGETGVALELHDAGDDRLLEKVEPTKEPHDTWRSAYVRAPRRPFVVVARDNDPQRWIAFSAPTEMSNLSYWAWQLMKNGFLIAEIAAVVAVLIALLTLSSRDPRRA